MQFGEIKQVILFGGGELLARFALQLKRDSFKVCVFTSKRHANEKVIEGPSSMMLEEFLKSHHINYHISTDINTDRRALDMIDSKTLGLSISAAWIFKRPFIKCFNGKLLNLHGHRLPENRGAGIFSWQILHDDRLGGMVIHTIDPGVDTGLIIKERNFRYPGKLRTPLDYKKENLKQGMQLLDDFLKDIKRQKEFKPIKQDESRSMYWPRLATEIHGFIDWNWKAKDIELFIRAFDEPYKGASTFINERRVFIRKCFLGSKKHKFHPFQNGIVYRKTCNTLYIASGDGSLVVNDVKDENGRDILADINVGDRFYTPIKFLEGAKRYRAFYTDKGLKKESISILKGLVNS